MQLSVFALAATLLIANQEQEYFTELQRRGTEIEESVGVSPNDQPPDGFSSWEAEEALYQGRQDRLRRDLRKPARFWFAELDSNDATRRTHGAEILKRAAEFVAEDDARRVRQFRDFIATAVFAPLFTEAERKRVVARYRRSFQIAVPDLIKRLDAIPQPSDPYDNDIVSPTIAACLAATSPDGSGITRAWDELPPTPNRDALVGYYLYYTARTMPDGKPLYPFVIKAIRERSPQTKRIAESQWKGMVEGRDPVASFSLGMGIALGMAPFIERDRVQLELPLLKEILKPSTPPSLRYLGLACMGQLGTEVEALRAPVERILRSPNEDKLSRRLAAAALAEIDLDEAKLESLANLAGLRGEDRERFLTTEKQLIRNAVFHDADFDEAKGDPQIPSWSDMFRGMLHSENGVQKRHTLRSIRYHGPAAKVLRPDVHALLDDPSPETRRFARLALDAIGLQ